MPAEAAAVVVVEELVVHGWDLARAIGDPFVCTAVELALVDGFFDQFGPGQRSYAYVPACAAGAAASPLDRVIACSGRDSSWSVGP